MLSNDPKNPQASPQPDPTAQTPVLDPHSPIETASGTGTTTDPTVKDTPPPPYTDPDSLV